MTPPGDPSKVFLSVVVVAGYERPYLPACIESICASSLDRSHYEVVLAWGFDRPDWAARFEELGVRLVRTAPGLREGEMLCEAIPHAQGEVLVFMEDDDEFAPDKLARVEEVFRREPRLALYNHDESAIDEGGRSLGWVHSVNGFNLSSHSVRVSLVQRFLAPLRSVTMAPDHLIFWTGHLFGEATLHEGRLLTRYRIHHGNYHLGKDPTHDLGVIFGVARAALREGRPVRRTAVRIATMYLALRGTRMLVGKRAFLPMARLYSQVAWHADIRRAVLSREGRRAHPPSRPLMVTI